MLQERVGRGAPGRVRGLGAPGVLQKGGLGGVLLGRGASEGSGVLLEVGGGAWAGCSRAGLGRGAPGAGARAGCSRGVSGSGGLGRGAPGGWGGLGGCSRKRLGRLLGRGAPGGSGGVLRGAWVGCSRGVWAGCSKGGLAGCSWGGVLQGARAGCSGGVSGSGAWAGCSRARDAGGVLRSSRLQKWWGAWALGCKGARFQCLGGDWTRSSISHCALMFALAMCLYQYISRESSYDTLVRASHRITHAAQVYHIAFAFAPQRRRVTKIMSQLHGCFTLHGPACNGVHALNWYMCVCGKSKQRNTLIVAHSLILMTSGSL